MVVTLTEISLLSRNAFRGLEINGTRQPALRAFLEVTDVTIRVPYYRRLRRRAVRRVDIYSQGSAGHANGLCTLFAVFCNRIRCELMSSITVSNTHTKFNVFVERF